MIHVTNIEIDSKIDQDRSFFLLHIINQSMLNLTSVSKLKWLHKRSELCTILQIPQVSTDGYKQANCFLCSYMPYPKKTNMMEIWSLHIQAIVQQVCMGERVHTHACMRAFLSLCLPCFFQSALMHRDTAATLILVEEIKRIWSCLKALWGMWGL